MSIGKRPICQACNRPFDPTSPGATLTMGPTCAKRASLITLDDSGPQLNLITNESGAGMSKLPLGALAAPKKKRNAFEKGLERASARKIPKRLEEQFILAKIAFDDLYREFHATGAVLYGNEALHCYQELKAKNSDEFSLSDPVLPWLEAEHNIHLLKDRETGQTFYFRILNETFTLLALSPEKSPEAQKNVATIYGYCEALRTYRKIEAVHQLSLRGF
jgi:hypothetical protein